MGLTLYALLFTIAAIGISEASYLVSKRKADEAPVCPIGGGCETVLKSRYNRILGIHNDILGLAFYVAAAILAGAMVIYEQDAYIGPLLLLALAVMLFGATIMSSIFFYLQWRILRAWCFWCLMSALTIVIMDIIVILIYLS